MAGCDGEPMYLVLVRAPGLRTVACDAAEAFREAVLSTASSSDGLAHIYAARVENGVEAVLFVLAPTLEQAEESARRVCLEACDRTGLILERCDVDLILVLEEATWDFPGG